MSALITLFTDAGYCPDTKVASYAVWAKTAGQPTVRKSGLLRGKLEGSDIAELRALVNGVYVVLRAMKPEPGTKIIAQTDCTSAISALLGTGYRSPSASARVKHVRTEMRKHLRQSNVEIEYRHVKGHSGTGTRRSAVNTWCDAECRRWLKQGRVQAGTK